MVQETCPRGSGKRFRERKIAKVVKRMGVHERTDVEEKEKRREGKGREGKGREGKGRENGKHTRIAAQVQADPRVDGALVVPRMEQVALLDDLLCGHDGVAGWVCRFKILFAPSLLAGRVVCTQRPQHTRNTHAARHSTRAPHTRHGTCTPRHKQTDAVPPPSILFLFTRCHARPSHTASRSRSCGCSARRSPSPPCPSSWRGSSR